MNEGYLLSKNYKLLNVSTSPCFCMCSDGYVDISNFSEDYKSEKSEIDSLRRVKVMWISSIKNKINSICSIRQEKSKYDFHFENCFLIRETQM